MTETKKTAPEPVMVELTPAEREEAIRGGGRRQYSNRDRPNALKAGQTRRLDPTVDGTALHVQGACGERAFAKAAGMPWAAWVNNPWGLPGDVGRTQVRTVVRGEGDRRRARLRAHTEEIEEHPDDPFVHVIADTDLLRFWLMGWVFGRQIAVPPFRPQDGVLGVWDDPQEGRWAWWVETNKLTSMTPLLSKTDPVPHLLLPPAPPPMPIGAPVEAYPPEWQKMMRDAERRASATKARRGPR